MSTMSLPRGAAASLAALVVAGSALAGAQTATAAPGDNGDVKIHSMETDPSNRVNQPKVCDFYLAAFDFDGLQNVTWNIAPQPAQTGGATRSGTIVLDPNGDGHTAQIPRLPDGMYKLTWTWTGENGAGKQKVFQVDCTAPTSPPPTNGPGGNGGGYGGGHGGPHGGPPAGGGGLAKEEAFSPVAGAAAVGLAAVAGTVWIRLRRRTHGAA